MGARNGGGPATAAGRRDGVRVEHRAENRTTVVSHRIVLLAPLAATLEAAGEGGELVVVDEASGRVLIRWSLASAGGGPCPPA